jgi:hypothetical protein
VAATLSTVVEHPLVLLVALVLSAPFIWQIGRSWFASIEQDAKDAVVPVIIDAAGGPLIPTWLLLKMFWFGIVSTAIVVTFYKIGSWIAKL